METKDIVLIGMLGAMLFLSILLMAWNLVSPLIRCNRRKVIILRMNNGYARDILEGNGFILCKDALDGSASLLYSLDGKTIQGCTGSNELVPFKRIRWQVVDCGMDLSFFIYEMHKVAWRMR